MWQLIKAMIIGTLNSRARYDMTKIIQLLQIYLRSAEIELASGKEPERGSVLPDDMIEKLQQYIADKDREGTETQARRSEMMPPAGKLTTGGEMPEELVEDCRLRLQAMIGEAKQQDAAG